MVGGWNFGPFWATLGHFGCLGHFGPPLATLGHFGPLWATWAVWATFGHFGQMTDDRTSGTIHFLPHFTAFHESLS